MKNINLKFSVLTILMIFFGLSVVQVQARVNWRTVAPILGTTAVVLGTGYLLNERRKANARMEGEQDVQIRDRRLREAYIKNPDIYGAPSESTSLTR